MSIVAKLFTLLVIVSGILGVLVIITGILVSMVLLVIELKRCKHDSGTDKRSG